LISIEYILYILQSCSEVTDRLTITVIPLIKIFNKTDNSSINYIKKHLMLKKIYTVTFSLETEYIRYVSYKKYFIQHMLPLDFGI